MSRSRSLYQSIFLKTAILAITPILIIALLAYSLLIPEFRQHVNDENQALTRAIRVQIELFLKAPQLVLNGISAEFQVLPNFSSNEVRRILDGQIENNSAFDALYLVNSNSQIDLMGLPLQRQAFRDDYEGLALTKSKFISEARRRQSPYWSTTFLSAVSGKNSLALAIPVNDKVLVGEFSIEQLSRFIQQIKADDNLLIIITDQLGQIIAHPDPDQAARQRNISNLPVIKGALAKRALTQAFKLNGVEHIGSSLPIPELGWTVLVAQPLAIALADVQAIKTILLISFVVATLLALIMSRIIAARLSAPFEQFAKSAAEVSKGEYQRRLPHSQITEVSTLSQSFTAMVNAIQEREDSLEQSRQKYREVVEGTDDLVTRVDSQGKFTYVNHSARHIFGLQPQSCIGRSAFDFIHPDDLGKTTSAFQEWQVRGLKTTSFENRQINLSGEVHHILWSINIHYDEEGNVFELSSIGHDITQRILSEQENRRLQKYLGNIIDSMPSTIIGINQDGIITQWNRHAETVFELTRERAIGQNISTLNAFIQLDQEAIHQAITTGRTQTIRNKTKTHEFELRFEDITIFPLINDNIEGVVIRIDDVTEKIRLEEMMIQSEKMLSVGGLAAGMAHEINNPLAGILQNTQVIKNRLSADIKKNQDTAKECGTELETINDYMDQRGINGMFDSVVESGRRAARIVENMLNFSRKSESQMIPHNLANLLDRTLELAVNDYDLRKRFDFRQIELIKEYDANLSKVVCDDSKIQQVILNLLKNAAQAMANQPKDQPRITLRLIGENELARIEVEDNGPGMSEKVRKRIFEPFFTTKSVGTGTGLGLSVSYFIITENHKGMMSVESAPGKGARFIIRLPIHG